MTADPKSFGFLLKPRGVVDQRYPTTFNIGGAVPIALDLIKREHALLSTPSFNAATNAGLTAGHAQSLMLHEKGGDPYRCALEQIADALQWRNVIQRSFWDAALLLDIKSLVHLDVIESSSADLYHLEDDTAGYIASLLRAASDVHVITRPSDIGLRGRFNEPVMWQATLIVSSEGCLVREYPGVLGETRLLGMCDGQYVEGLVDTAKIFEGNRRANCGMEETLKGWGFLAVVRRDVVSA
ncbi:hypothetical protein LTS18_009476 [Coniosporium uncinatum]|uniref:Uncharacterized protein n=1 Tax=Coniosporium uncinatum TaxID=93489 RepID=A0ACC3DLZ8_9PEZI|nr:hypothetical protein LTS18_009476 [Coniosporium uncinatum]